MRPRARWRGFTTPGASSIWPPPRCGGRLRERETDLASSAPLLAQLVDVELRRGRIQAAEEAASRLEQLSETLEAVGPRAMALFCRGRVEAAAGGDAEAALWRRCAGPGPESGPGFAARSTSP
ncbi:MAG TPA: hypothetical protein VE953_26380 [Terriglobales bacterium]|nr:hypothetical protein [Terriglobales bacterium]